MISGSSSTAVASEYLGGVPADCAYQWVIGVGKGNADSSAKTVPTANPMWPADTTAAEGSGGVSDAIFANKYSIGYIDSGHGRGVIETKHSTKRRISSSSSARLHEHSP